MNCEGALPKRAAHPCQCVDTDKFSGADPHRDQATQAKTARAQRALMENINYSAEDNRSPQVALEALSFSSH